MKNTIILLTLALLFIPLVYAQNESSNETVNQTIVEPQWYDSYVSGVLAGDTIALITAIIGLAAVYIFGKIAFRFIKWAIIILVIVLIFKVVF